MIWAILSVLSGFFDAVGFAILKKLNSINGRLLLFLRYAFTLPFLLAALYFYDIPQLTPYFYIIMALNITVSLAGTYLMINSLHNGSMSKSIPMLSFTPVFLLLVSFVLLGEFPSTIGLIGIIVVVMGSYAINISLAKEGLSKPFMNMFSDKGTFYMLLVAFLFSLSATFSKIAINLSNPGFYNAFQYTASSALLLVLFRKNIFTNKDLVRKHFRVILLLGIATALTELFYSIAVKLDLVAYTISLKRTSVIFSVILGYFMFREKNFRESIIGASIMLIGAAMILSS